MKTAGVSPLIKGKGAESALLEGLREGREGAFEALYHQYSGRVHRLALRFLHDEEQARNALQETFLRVFRKVHTFRGDSSLSTWLYRVTINHCKNRIKYLSRRKDLQKKEFEDERTERPSLDRSTAAVVHRPDEEVEAMQMEDIIQRTLEDLDEDHRTILVLREIQGMTYQQIGEIMKLEEGTVKSKLHRARSTFMARMKKAYEDGPGERA